MTSLPPEKDVNLSPVKYTRRRQIADLSEEMYEQAPEGPALQRVFQIAKSKFATAGDQMAAIAIALQQELAAIPAPSSAQLNIEAFRQDLAPGRRIDADAPIPWLENNRPSWADRHNDQDRHATNDVHSGAGCMSWRSTCICVPLSEYFGKWHTDGHYQSAEFRFDLRQNVTDAQPHIGFARHGFDSNRNIVDGVSHTELTVAEAANFARVLLLLVDLAIESDSKESN